MAKPQYPNEQSLRKYIQNTIIKHRNRRDAIRYIKEKLEHYSYSDDFINWCQDLCQKLEKNQPITTSPTTTAKAPTVKPLPTITFGKLTKAKEDEHIHATTRHIKESERNLFEAIEATRHSMNDLKNDIRYSNAEDRPFLINEHLKKSHAKEDLQNEARFATAAINSPYFGRLDFKYKDGSPSILYISKTNTSSYVKNHHNVHFTDWRAPIADLYYRYPSPTQNVSFKNGEQETITGDISLTARFKVEHGVITNISFSSDHQDHTVKQARDDSLQEKLASNSGEHMTEIVETIQPEQNAIVRQGLDKDIIVQGVAGSGKTAVALHRIAYLIYQKPELRHGKILFISPNATFSDYVSNVLPELGELYIPIITFAQALKHIFNGTLEKYDHSPDDESLKALVEKYYQTGKLDKNIQKKYSVSFTKKFYKLCDRIVQLGELRRQYFILQEEIASLEKDVKNYYDKSIKLLRDRLKVTNSHKKRSTIPEEETRADLANLIAKRQKIKTRLTTLRKSFAVIKRKLEKASDEIVIQKNKDVTVIKLIKTPLQYFKTICDDPKANSKSYDNISFISILRLLIDQANGKRRKNLKIEHVVVDEAQDYTEPFIHFLRLAYPNAVFTILGDNNQNVNPYYMHKSINQLLPDVNYFEMNKAYRSSPEIVSYCNQILGITSVKAARSSNNEPVQELRAKDAIETITAATKYYRQKGYERISIITRNQNKANRLKREIKDDSLIILPVYQAKGLEFDATIVIDEFKKSEKELFYVACSRAQHGLTVIHQKVAKTKPRSTSSKRPVPTKPKKPSISKRLISRILPRASRGSH